MNTTIPAIVESYDGQYVSARPANKMRLANGQELDAPIIHNIPVCWMVADGGNALITLPLKKGDDVLLHFAQRAVDKWLDGDGAAPEDPRRFDLNDAFCTPVWRPTQGKADTDNIVVAYGDGKLSLSKNGDLTITSDHVKINGELTVTGEVTGNGVKLSAHKHEAGLLVGYQGTDIQGKTAGPT